MGSFEASIGSGAIAKRLGYPEHRKNKLEEPFRRAGLSELPAAAKATSRTLWKLEQGTWRNAASAARLPASKSHPNSSAHFYQVQNASRLNGEEQFRIGT